jgi:hypothetical protein
MNREDKVIDFYIQVADELCYGRDWCVTGVDDPLRRFAALIAAAEREACAKVADDYAGNQQAWSCGLDSPEEYRMQAGHECADAIRARGLDE